MDHVALRIPFAGDCFGKFVCRRVQRAPRRRFNRFPVEQDRTALTDMIEARGHSLDRMRVRAFPFHSSVNSFVADHDFVFVVEQNRDSQLRSSIVNECGIDPVRLVPILHYDGTPITARFIAKTIGDHLDKLTVKPMKVTS